MRVVIDIDGVLADFNTAFRELLIDYGADMRPFGPHGPDCWDWPSPYGASVGQEALAWQHIEREPDWWETLDAHPDFLTEEDMQLLGQVCDQHETTIVTHRYKGTGRLQSWEWLASVFGLPLGVPVITTPAGKQGALLALAPDVVIEDRLPTLSEWLAVPSVKGTGILIDRPYNRGIGRVGVPRLQVERTSTSALRGLL